MPSLALKFEVEFAIGDAHSVPSLMPDPDTVVTFNHDGTPCNLFSDRVWLVDGGGPRPLQMDFQSIASAGTKGTSHQNVNITMRVMLHQMYASTVRTLETLRGQWFVVRSAAIHFCSQGIRLDQLWKFDAAIDAWAESTPYSALAMFAGICAGLHTMQSMLGFYILSPQQIRRLHAAAARKRAYASQTPYIPERLHNALLAECHRTVDFFVANLESVETLYPLVADAYKERRHHKRRRYADAFLEHGPLAAELRRLKRMTTRPMSLVRYLNDVRQSALIIVSNYTLTRKSEALHFRDGCYREISDPHLGRVSMMQGPTRKTQDNPHALWVSTPKIVPALQALAAIADLVATQAGRHLQKEFALFSRLPVHFTGHVQSNHEHPSFALASFAFYHAPRFLSSDEFRITHDDFDEAVTVTPNLDRDKFSVGTLWRFALHQFRRSMIVRCAASGIVSPQALRFQAKHSCETMTWHYMSNYWKLKRSPDATDTSLALTDESVAEEISAEHAIQYNQSIEFARTNARFFTPYGEKLRHRMLDSVPLLTLDKIKRGEDIGILKQTTLGLCTFSGNCPFSTAKSVKGCLTKNEGGICTSALVDTDHEAQIREVIEEAKDELEVLGPNPRYKLKREALEADIDYGERALEMIDQAQRKKAA